LRRNRAGNHNRLAHAATNAGRVVEIVTDLRQRGEAVPIPAVIAAVGKISFWTRRDEGIEDDPILADAGLESVVGGVVTGRGGQSGILRESPDHR
jgi:hypothetical protein